MTKIEMRTKECIVCKQTFEYVPSKKTCSMTCFRTHRKNRKSKTSKINSVARNCRFCNQTYVRERERNGFCYRSCASKYYVANGTYDNWQQAGMELNKEKLGNRIEKYCATCNKQYFVIKALSNSVTCSRACQGTYKSENYSGENSHLYGMKLPQERIDKQVNTMMERYGVPNAFFLTPNRKTVSKGQLELFELLTQSLNSVEVQKEKRVNVAPKEFYADILLPKHDIIIEYNGDFWHANPNKYTEDYYNPKKQLFAREIWALDKIRLEKLQEKYKVYIVWESDFARNKKEVLTKLVENIKNDIG